MGHANTGDGTQNAPSAVTRSLRSVPPLHTKDIGLHIFLPASGKKVKKDFGKG